MIAVDTPETEISTIRHTDPGIMANLFPTPANCSIRAGLSRTDSRLEWNCQVRRSECERLGAELLALSRREDARSEYERACQYGLQPALCLDLARLYRDGN